MAIAILGDVDAADAARVRAFAADALAELGAASLEVPVKVVAEGEGSAGWATSSGVYICADQLDEGDDELRWVVAEEVAHFWFLREHGDAAMAHFVEEARGDPRVLRRLQRLLDDDS